MTNIMTHDKILEELYELTEIEQDRDLNATQNARYLWLIETCSNRHICIPFGVTV